MTGTFVPTYQGLSAIDLVRPAHTTRPACYPFDAPGRLPFYRARNAIYHLFRALVAQNPALTVLAPDYNSGNEILAMRAAGARLHYYPVDRQMQIDPEAIERLCDRHGVDLLYVIHYVGWPQPMPVLVDLCRRRGILLVEDCALSLLSEHDGQPLGSFGDWSVFCLYKTLPLPNGALLVQNGLRLEALDHLQLRDAGSASVLGRTAELLVQRLRGRVNYAGAALLALKRAVGRAAGALDVRRANVGDIGFEIDEVDLAMSTVSARLLERLDYQQICRTRIDNYRLLDAQLDPAVTRVFPRLPDGACPLFFPVIVPDKPAAARALQRRGIDALEFWNDSVESGEEMSDDARFLRAHVLELPIHQDLTARHIAYMAQQVSSVLGRPRSLVSCGSPAAAVRVETIDSTEALARIRPEWDALLRASAADNPFLTWEWQQSWCEHLMGAGTPHVLCVRSGEDLIGIAPFVRRGGPLGSFASLEFLGTGQAGSDYLDVIARRGAETTAIDALAASLAAGRCTLRLDHMLEGSLSAQLAGRLAARGWSTLDVPDGICPVIPLEGHTWLSYLDTCGAAHRANVRRRMRALERQFRVEFTQVRTDAERTAALAALAGFHEQRFQQRGGSTAFQTPALRAFHDAATRRALECGWLRMYELRLDDTAVAVMYGLYHGGQFYFYQHGFDHRYERFSIGLVLMAQSLRAAIEEGARAFDMLWGNEPYKRLWAREALSLRRIHLFPGDFSGRLRRGAVLGRRFVGPLARRAVTRPAGDARAT